MKYFVVHISGLLRRNGYSRWNQHNMNMLLHVSYRFLLIEVCPTHIVERRRHEVATDRLRVAVADYDDLYWTLG
jgi:hypothetical protein